MVTVMKLAHHRPCPALPGEGSSGNTSVAGALLLEQLAVLCDKYQCPSILAIGEQWFQAVYTGLKKTHRESSFFSRYFRNTASDNPCLRSYLTSCSRLLVFCWVADMPDSFCTLCSDIVKYHVGPIASFVGLDEQTSGTTMLGHVLLPRFLAGCFTNKHNRTVKLEGERLASLNMLYKSLLEPARFPVSSTPKGQCPQRQRVLGAYLQAIARIFTSDTTYESINSLAASVKTAMHKTVRKEHLENCKGKIYHPCTCIDFMSFQKDVRERLRIFETDQTPVVCMDCLRTGGRSKQEKVCRVSH